MFSIQITKISSFSYFVFCLTVKLPSTIKVYQFTDKTAHQQHFEQLALSKEDVNFDAEYHKLNKYEVSIITEIVKERQQHT